jgi:hypothetical protein
MVVQSAGSWELGLLSLVVIVVVVELLAAAWSYVDRLEKETK